MKTDIGRTNAQHTSKDDKDDLKSLPMRDLMSSLESSSNGLSATDAQKRLERYGPNSIEEKSASSILKFLSYFWGPIP